MRGHLILLVAAGCGFQSPGGDPGQTSPPPPPGPGDPVAVTRSFDAATLRSGQLIDMTVDTARGALTPSAYTYGGLVGHGLKGLKVWTHEASAWNLIASKIPTGAGLWGGERMVNPPQPQLVRLDYLGVFNDTTMTIWLEGEVFLPAGANQLRVSGDDIGFLDLAVPGSANYTRRAENGAASITAATAAWYPVRVGFANGDVPFDFQFRHTDPGGSETAWTRDRLRARTSELDGVLRTVFGRQMLAGGEGIGGSQVAPPVPHFEQDKLLASNLFNDPPQGGGLDDNDWSARWAGQVHITTAGSYTLRIDSRDGSRGRLGTGTAEFGWARDVNTNAGDPQTVVTTNLEAGWNDLSVDYNQASGTRLLHVQMQGPDFATLTEVPREALRPVETHDDRLALGVNDQPQTIPNDGSAGNAANSTLDVIGYPGEVVSSLEFTYEINSNHWDGITVDLEPPGSPGTHIVLRDKDGSGGITGDKMLELAVPANATGALAGLLNGPAGGEWKLRAFDNPGGPQNQSSLIRARLTLHTRGGPDKVARTASWTSPVIDATTAAFAVDGVTWQERVPTGSSIVVRLATCQQASCADAVFLDPLTKATAVQIPRARYMQLRVEMTSNGTREPELQGLALSYRRDP
jgi:hypothetical protein